MSSTRIPVAQASSLVAEQAGTLALRWVVALLAAAAFVPVARAADPISDLPLPEMAVAKAETPPTVDGTLSPGEWDHAPAATAFMGAFKMELSHIQSVAWITYDDTYLYVAMKNNRGPKYTLLKKRGREPDDEKIVFDTSNEIWFTPPAAPAETYQTLFNAYPGVLDVKMVPSVGYNSKSWNGNWEIAASETRDHWIIEARAPIASFGRETIRAGDTWRGLFTTDVLGGAGFTAWAPGGAFAEINRHGYLHFRGDTPVFQLLDVESVFTGRAAFPMAVDGPAKGKSNVEVALRFGKSVQPSGGDMVLRKTVSVADGRRETFTLEGDLAKLDLPKNKEGVPVGYCEVTAKADGRTVLYHQVFPFALDGYRRTPPAEVVKSPYETPLGLEADYAPLNKKLIVKIDRYYLDRREDVAGGTARLVDPKMGRTVAEEPIAPFYYDYSRFAMDLARVQVPVETEAIWAGMKPILDQNREIEKENKERAKQGQKPLPLEKLPFQPAEYVLEIALHDDAGNELAKTETTVPLKGFQFEWLPNSIGISDAAIPPWTPLKWTGPDTIDMWNKRYRLDSLGLARQVTNAGRRQLSGPMRLVATVDGRDVEVRSGPLLMTKIKEGYADLLGFADGAGLKFRTETRVEFDGCVLNTMQITPQSSPRIERLSLVVTMPKSEAECYATTAGGWSSTFGWTPQHWDSRETSSGSIQGNFVPFLFLTDSERGFCFFADNEKGWLLDPEESTLEVDADEDKKTVTFRANFITRSGEVAGPTTVRYGWMVTPQKPQPPDWRGWKVDHHRPFPEIKAVFYGMDQTDWAVVWPYYSSPFPWDYEKSKKGFDSAKQNDVVLAAGNIAHSIGRYMDYKHRWFGELAADWGQVPGEPGGANVALSRGPNDFRLWHWDQWIKRSGLNGLYFDETYLAEDRNYLTGGAYLLEDGRIQPGYNFLGERELCKRLRYLFHEHGLEGPRIWFHTTANHPVYAWMPDVAMEGENVEPTSLENDYLSCLPASRLRAIGMGRNLGTVPLIMCQADRHWDDNFSPFCVPQLVGWVLAHDCLPENSAFWDVLAVESRIWRDDVRFLPYWKEGLGVTSLSKDVLASAHARPGDVLLWIVNTSRADRRADVALELKRLGLNPLDRNRPIRAFDAETGEPYGLATDKPNVAQLSVTVPGRFWRAVRLVQPKLLAAGQTFVARFEGEDGRADDCLGYGTPLGRAMGLEDFAQGKSGRGVVLDKALSFSARHHVTTDAGKITFQVHFDPAESRGTLLAIDRLAIAVDRGKLKVTADKEPVSETDLELPAGPAWHSVEVAWTSGRLSVRIGDRQFQPIALQGGMPLKRQARGLAIRGGRSRARIAQVTFGPLSGGVIDDLVMQSVP